MVWQAIKNMDTYSSKILIPDREDLQLRKRMRGFERVRNKRWAYARPTTTKSSQFHTSRRYVKSCRIMPRDTAFTTASSV